MKYYQDVVGPGNNYIINLFESLLKTIYRIKYRYMFQNEKQVSGGVILKQIHVTCKSFQTKNGRKIQEKGNKSKRKTTKNKGLCVCLMLKHSFNFRLDE